MTTHETLGFKKHLSGKKIECKELDAQNRLLLQEKIGLEKRLYYSLAKLHSERDDYGPTPPPPPPETTPSPTQEPSPELSLTAQLAQAEAVQLKKYLRKETVSLQKEVKALKKDLALQREKEEIFSSLKTHMAKKLQEKEVVVAELKGQLEALERETSQSNTKDIITLYDQPFNKEHKMLETRISERSDILVSSILCSLLTG